MGYREKALTFLRKSEVPISGAWVDGGCGYGIYSEALTLLGAQPVICIDSILSRLPRTGSSVNGDCRHLPVKSDSVSGFLYVNVLHSYKNPLSLVGEAHRILKKGGHLIIIEYKQRIPAPFNPYPLSSEEIETLLRSLNLQICLKTLVDTEYRPKHLIVGRK